MDGRPVLVCTEYEDATADLVIAELNRRRVPVLRFDPGRDFPAPAVLAARLRAGGWEGRLTVGERTADLSAVRALYHRRPSAYPTGSGEQAARFAAQENRRGLGGVLGALPWCLYLSHPQAIARAESPLVQPWLLCRSAYVVLRDGPGGASGTPSRRLVTPDPYTHLRPDEEDTTRATVEAVLGDVPPLCPATSA